MSASLHVFDVIRCAIIGALERTHNIVATPSEVIYAIIACAGEVARAARIDFAQTLACQLAAEFDEATAFAAVQTAYAAKRGGSGGRPS